MTLEDGKCEILFPHRDGKIRSDKKSAIMLRWPYSQTLGEAHAEFLTLLTNSGDMYKRSASLISADFASKLVIKLISLLNSLEF